MTRAQALAQRRRHAQAAATVARQYSSSGKNFGPHHGVVDANEALTPFVFDSDTGTITLTANSGPVAVPEGLYCPFHTPMLVDELRFRTISSPFPLLRTTINVGPVPICYDMPLELLGKPRDIGVETDLSFAGASTHTTAFHVWRLPKPMLLPRGARLDVRFIYDNRSGLFASPPDSVLPAVTMLGRAIGDKAKLPAMSHVPYAARWITALASTTEGSVLTEQSLPTDLKNQTAQQLLVQRFSAALTGVDANGNAMDDAQGAARNCHVRLYGENGILGVRDQTPVGVLFHHGNRSWNANTMLAPNGYYIADVDYTTLDLATQRMFTPQLGIGMVGYRDVPITSFGVPIDPELISR